MALIGYARVSTSEQKVDLQVDALAAAGVGRTFTDTGLSGTLPAAQRPGLTAALDYLREGDVLVVWKLDRLGRNTRSTLALLADLADRGIGFRSLTEGLDTAGPMGRAMLTIVSAFAELERDLISDRTKAGLAAARARGRIGGRPPALTDEQVKQVRALHAAGSSPSSLSRTFSCSRTTIYRALELRSTVEV